MALQHSRSALAAAWKRASPSLLLLSAPEEALALRGLPLPSTSTARGGWQVGVRGCARLAGAGPAHQQQPLQWGLSRLALPLGAAPRAFSASSTEYPPHTALGMPSLSPTMSQGNIAEWKKKEGEAVAAGDVLCEVETDKATIEWESVEEGFLAKVLLPDGAKDVPVGQVVAVLCEEEADVAAFASYKPAAVADDGAGAAPEADAASPSPAAPASDLPNLSLPPHAVLGMPSLSPTMTQGTLSAWKKSEGDEIEAGDILAEVETDKASIEWEAVDSGFLAKVFVQDGASDLDIGVPVAIVCEDKEDLAAFASLTAADLAAGGDASAPAQAGADAAPPAAAPTPAAAVVAAPQRAVSKRGGKHVPASPLAKAIAREAGLEDLAAVAGTGPEGRVIAADVREFLASRPAMAAAAGAESGAGARGAAMAADRPLDYQYEDVPVSQMRSVIARRLLESKQTIPHYYLTMDCEVDALMQLRQSVNASMAASPAGGKVSLNDFVIKASSLACREVPECNAEWREDCIRLHRNVHVGVAMDLGSLGHSQGGLVVPVVRDAHLLGVSDISARVKDYAARARPADGVDGKMRLGLDELDGGTFTISNLGMFGVKQFAAIVNPPQSTILAVGTVRKEVRKSPEDGTFREVSLMSVTLSCDHRVVDGAVGSKWLQHFKALVEKPLQMLV